MQDVDKAGGKGASLGEMTQNKFPIPPGFVILASEFDTFLDEADLRVEVDSELNDVGKDKMHTVERASERIQDMILRAKMPENIAEEIMKAYKHLSAPPARGGDVRPRTEGVGEKFFVAVRSSATAEDSHSAAWAGQLDSFLNTTEENLLKNVQRCWASLFTPRAIFYRKEHFQFPPPARGGGGRSSEGEGGAGTRISVAVVVQKMIQSDVSGIAFSVHPVTEDRDQIIIEAGWGLGEAIVSGSITPDSYVVSKKDKTILDINVSEQEKELVYRKTEKKNIWKEVSDSRRDFQKLTGEQIMKLAEIIERIEQHYGFPCDIEWALSKGKFYITQSRPITTLVKNESEKSSNLEEDVIVRINKEEGLELKKIRLDTYTDVDVSDLIKVHTREMSLLFCTLIGHSYRDTAKGIGLEDFFWAMADQSLMISNGDDGLVDLYRLKEALRKAKEVLFEKTSQNPSFLEDGYHTARKRGAEVKRDIALIESVFTKSKIDRKILADTYDILRKVVITYFLLQVTPLAVERVFQASSNKEFLEKHSNILVCWRKDLHGVQQIIEGLLKKFTCIARKMLSVDFDFYTDSEVSNFLAGKISEIDISSRQCGYALLWLFEEVLPYELVTGERYNSTAEHVAHVDTEDMESVPNLYKGAGIGEGTVRGVAYKVRTIKDINKVPKNAIIIANVLELEHLVQIKRIDGRVIGIVTEEGGITSHIAIMGREFGIPIVTGVSGIMKKVTSNTALIVDANRGTVKIRNK